MLYLQNRQFKVYISRTSSEKVTISYSVLQGSILGPALFKCYFSSIKEIMPNNLSGYADDHSLTESFKPGKTTVKENLECKVKNVKKWVIENYLKMNDSKIEFWLLVQEII